MKKFMCPHCHKDSISLWQKANMGGLSGMASCNECGTRLSTPLLWRLLSFSPFFGLLAVINWLALDLQDNPWIYVGVFCLCIILQVVFVPVIATPKDIVGQKAQNP